MKILKTVYGPVTDGESELTDKWQLYKAPDMIVDIEIRKLEWLIRFDQTGMAKTIVQIKRKIREN
jgi:hypothetical protein